MFGNIRTIGWFSKASVPYSNQTAAFKNAYATSATPSFIPDTGAGTGTVSITGTNTSGKITVNVVNGSAAGQDIGTITFSGSFTLPTGCYPVISAGNSAMALEITKIYATGTTTTFKITLAAAQALTDATSYVINYIVIGN